MGPAATGEGQGRSCWVLASRATQVASVLKCWEGRDQSVTWVLSLGSPNIFAGLAGRLWLSQ